MKTCTGCNQVKDNSHFYLRGDGSGFRSKCKLCQNPGKMLKCNHCGEDWHKKGPGFARNDSTCDECYPLSRKADILFAAAFDRSKRKNLEFNLTREFLIEKLRQPCPKLGVPFYLGPNGRNYKDRHPLSASIDKIEASKGYVEDNIQIVCWWYNLSKSIYSDKEVLDLCRMVVNLSDTKVVQIAEVQMD